MILEPKSDQRIQSEMAAFAGQLPDYAAAIGVRQHLGDSAVKLLAGEPIVFSDKNYEGDIVEHEVKPTEYVEFLRGADEDTRTDINFITGRMERFDSEFAPLVEAHFQEVGSGDKARKHNSYLGSGSNGSAFRVEKDGQEYAVKKGGFSYFDVRGFRSADHIEGVSHLVAADLQRGYAVMNLVPGVLAPTLSPEQRANITDSQISGVISKTIELWEAGINVDPKPTNFLYDRAQGFGIIDYHARNINNEKENLPDSILSLRIMLGETYKNSGFEYGTPEYEQYAYEFTTGTIAIDNRLLDILEAEHPEILAQAAAIQAERNSDPRVSGGMMLDTEFARRGDSIIDAYEQRLISLGLADKKLIARANDYDVVKPEIAHINGGSDAIDYPVAIVNDSKQK